MPSNVRRSPLQQLVRRFLKWIGRQFGLGRPQPPGELVEATDQATLYQVASSELGVCGCYWICHQGADSDLVISLISLEQLRQDAALQRGYRRTTDPVRISGRKPFSQELEEYLESQGGLDIQFVSHIFVAAWRSRIPSQIGERRTYLVRPLGAIPGDFQGLTNAWSAGDRVALKVIELVGRRLLRLKPSPLNSWEELVNAVDWQAWLEFYIQKMLGTAHILQPRKGARK